LTILCDEIHADLVYAAADGADSHVQTHTPLACLADADDPLLTAVAPSKTFNIPGLGLSATVSTHAAVARRLANTFARTGVSVGNPFSLAGFEAAYAHGEAWLDACLGVLRANRDAVMAAVEAHPRLRAHAPQGSYLAWLDCRAAGLDDTQLQRAWVEAGLGLSPGIGFGAAGSGFMRLNFAVPPSQLRSCLSRLPQLLG
jgi:cystathionine beta-lyase